MDFVKECKKAIAVLKLDQKATKKLAKEKEAWKIGILFLAIGGVLGGIASHLQGPREVPTLTGDVIQYTPSFIDILIAPIQTVILIAFAVGVLHLTIKLFSGKSTYKQLFTLLSFASLLSWLKILAIQEQIAQWLGLLFIIWYAVVEVNVIRTLNKFSILKSVIILLMPIVAVIVLLFVIFTIQNI